MNGDPPEVPADAQLRTMLTMQAQILSQAQETDTAYRGQQEAQTQLKNTEMTALRHLEHARDVVVATRTEARQALEYQDIHARAAMAHAHEERILEMAPQVKNRLFLLKEFAVMKNSDLDVPDPIGRPLEFYAEILSIIKAAVDKIADIL